MNFASKPYISKNKLQSVQDKRAKLEQKKQAPLASIAEKKFEAEDEEMKDAERLSNASGRSPSRSDSDERPLSACERFDSDDLDGGIESSSSSSDDEVHIREEAIPLSNMEPQPEK